AGNAIAPEARTCLILAPFLGQRFRAGARRIAALALVHPAVVFAGRCLVPLAATAELRRIGAVFALKAPRLTGRGALEDEGSAFSGGAVHLQLTAFRGRAW